jgi:hypothetical protein
MNGCTRTMPAWRPGALLLETMLALAIFIMAAAAILTMVDQSLTGLGRSRLSEQAVDVARTAMAKIEAGIATPQSLHGPVRPWLEEAAQRGDGAGSSVYDEGAGPTPWELQIGTEPSQFAGLTRVTVTAIRRDDRRGDAVAAMYTLRQLVRLGSKGEDQAGEEDPLIEAARRGLNERNRSRGTSGGER